MEFKSFDILNRESIPVMGTKELSCVPDISDLTSMQKAGYKFRVNGKITTLKKMRELLSAQEG